MSDYDQVGYPTFRSWPSAHALTYEGTYWKWVERSWQAGLRMMVTLLVDNDVLCGLQANRVNSCDEMEGAKLQRQPAVRDAGLHRRPVRRAGQGLPADRDRPLPGAPRRGAAQAGGGHGHGDLGAVRLPRQRPQRGVRPRPRSTGGWPSSAGWGSARSSRCTSSTTRWAAPRWTAETRAWWSTRATRSRSAATGTPGPAPGAETDNTQSGNAGALADALAGSPLAGLCRARPPSTRPARTATRAA